MVEKKLTIKNISLVIVVLILMVLIVFMVGKTFGFFSYAKEGAVVNSITIRGLTVNIDSETDDALNIVNAYPMYDSQGMENEAFIFTVTNNSSHGIDYNLIVENDSDKLAECLQTNETCPELSTDYIRYSYKVDNGTWSSPANLGDNSNIIHIDSIDANQSTQFSIKLWIDEDAGNEIQGHYFFGKLVLSGEKYDMKNVTLNAQGGTLTDTVIQIKNGSILNSLPTPVRGNDEFIEWCLDSKYQNPIDANYVVTNDITLYAHYKHYLVKNGIKNDNFTLNKIYGNDGNTKETAKSGYIEYSSLPASSLSNYITVNSLDITEYNLLKFDGTINGQNEATGNVFVSKQTNINYYDCVTYHHGGREVCNTTGPTAYLVPETRLYTLDISNLEGNYYIGFTSSNRYIYIYNLWLE